MAFEALTERAPDRSTADRSVELALEGMTCAACAARIEKVLNRLPGVSANVNFASEKARVTYAPGGAGLERGEANVEFDGARVSKSDPTAAIEDTGYDLVG